MTPPDHASAAPLDPVIRKKVLRMIPYGMYVLTACHESRRAAATIDWVTQSSFEPPMVVCCLRKDSLVYEIISLARRYAIHPLGEKQKDFAKHFFKNKDADEHQINGQAFQSNPDGVPILAAPPAHLVLELVDELTQGDHAVVMGKVTAVALNQEVPPLLLRDTGWSYGG